MATRYDSSGRVQPIEFGNLISPATCVLCNRIGRERHEIFANLGIELEFYGGVYLCQDCCLELAGFVMAVPHETVELYRITVEELKKDLTLAHAQNEYLRGLLDARIKSAGVIVGEFNSDGNDDVSLPEVESAATEVDRLINEYKSKSA